VRSTAPIAADWHDGQSEIFLKPGLDGANHLDPSRQITLQAHIESFSDQERFD
jgi:hypothetical protein